MLKSDWLLWNANLEELSDVICSLSLKVAFMEDFQGHLLKCKFLDLSARPTSFSREAAWKSVFVISGLEDIYEQRSLRNTTAVSSCCISQVKKLSAWEEKWLTQGQS